VTSLRRLEDFDCISPLSKAEQYSRLAPPPTPLSGTSTRPPHRRAAAVPPWILGDVSELTHGSAACRHTPDQAACVRQHGVQHAQSDSREGNFQQLHSKASARWRYRAPLLQQNQRLTQRWRQRRLRLRTRPHSTVVRVLTAAPAPTQQQQQHSRLRRRPSWWW